MSWRGEAACRGMGFDRFFPSNQGDKEQREAAEAEAKAICKRCPVKIECYEWAKENGEVGIWGEATEVERTGSRNPSANKRVKPENRVRRQRIPLSEASDHLCGSPSGYTRHSKRGEEPCERCRTAHTAYRNELNHYKAKAS